jgi:hypothetical protein
MGLLIFDLFLFVLAKGLKIVVFLFSKCIHRQSIYMRKYQHPSFLWNE